MSGDGVRRRCEEAIGVDINHLSDVYYAIYVQDAWHDGGIDCRTSIRLPACA